MICTKYTVPLTDGQNFVIESGVTVSSSSANSALQAVMPTVSLPPAVFQRAAENSSTNSTGLVFVHYSESTLFPVSSNASSSSSNNSIMTQVGSQIIAATVVQGDATFEDLQEPVLVLLPLKSIDVVSARHTTCHYHLS